MKQCKKNIVFVRNHKYKLIISIRTSNHSHSYSSQSDCHFSILVSLYLYKSAEVILIKIKTHKLFNHHFLDRKETLGILSFERTC